MLQDKISHALNKNLKVGGLFLDMSKAFDCVDLDVYFTNYIRRGSEGLRTRDSKVIYLVDRKRLCLITAPFAMMGSHKGAS